MESGDSKLQSRHAVEGLDIDQKTYGFFLAPGWRALSWRLRPVETLGGEFSSVAGISRASNDN